jgi:hypothetical protein
MDLINSILCEIEITTRTRRKIEAEPDPRRGSQYPTAMEVPRMEWIVKIAVRGIVA